MRTAKEIINEAYLKSNSLDPNSLIYEMALNTARRECLEEAAKVATTKCYNEGHVPVHKVDKQSILNLIKQLK